jgi:prepilin-type N-terminal cleavage/methylation domain-containing protein
MNNVKGYTLVEVLTVVAIVGILATISGPTYTQHRRRAIASEAVAGITLIRQAARDYRIVSGSYFDVTSNNIQNAYPTSVSAGIPTPSSAGVDVDVEVARYFSNQTYTIDATSPSSGRFSSPPVVDFLISVNGGASVACTSSVVTNCATQAATVSQYDLEMDNSGRIFISYDNGTTWHTY